MHLAEVDKKVMLIESTRQNPKTEITGYPKITLKPWLFLNPFA